MHRVIRPLLAVAIAALAMVVMLPLAAPAGAATTDTLVTVGSPTTPFPRNKQNEPALAVDASHPLVLAAGSNDEIDLAPCKGSSCPFTAGVGVSGIYFSFDGGNSWTQPTYTGWSARTGTAKIGPIGTLPGYVESGLVSDGDPALAFGPRPGPHGFSWSNGSRLYYANLTSNFSAVRAEETFNGFEGIAVSRTDNLASAAAGSNAAWMAPVIVSQRLSSTTFSDKEQLWADNASSSSHFGNVYVCWASFRGQEKGHAAPAPLLVSRSTDGGATWGPQSQITAAVNNGQNPGRSGCTIRTDSHGVVYVFYMGTDTLTRQTAHFLSRSFDGGVTWERPFITQFVAPTGVFDPVEGRPVFDGIAGARADLSAAPSVDIANGAPTGTGATNEIVDAWADARAGLNHEHALISGSTNGGATWAAPQNVTDGADRPEYVAAAISPTGSDVYLTYLGFTTAFQNTTTAPRLMLGVFRHADVGAGGALGAFATLHRGTPGDARGSSANSLRFEFLGDYVYTIATRTYGSGVWTDTRNAADCSAIDAFRASLFTATPLSKPAPLTVCAATFGNTDIDGISLNDPTP